MPNAHRHPHESRDRAPPGAGRRGAIAITPNGRSAYVVVNYYDDTVSVIGTASNTVSATIDVGAYSWAIAITP